MRAILCCIALLLFLFAPAAALPSSAQNLPACNTHVMTRKGNQITIGLPQLTGLLNQQFNAAHSGYTNLRLADQGNNRMKISFEKDGTPISISGPLTLADDGTVKLHAKHIVRNGMPEKALMDLFGKDLADYADFNQTDILSGKGNDLFIHPNPLLKVSSPVTKIWLHGSMLTLKFASQPCR